MADQNDRPPGFQRIHQLAQVKHVVRNGVGSTDRPVGVTVTAQVRCYNVEVLTQIERDEIPAAAMVAAAVNQDSERLVGIAPIDVVQLQPLRVVKVRSGSDYVRHRHASS